MAQPRSPKIDWLVKAWGLSTVLIDLPDRPLVSESFGKLPLDDGVEPVLLALLDRVNEQIGHSVRRQSRKKENHPYRAEIEKLPAIDWQSPIAVFDRLTALDRLGVSVRQEVKLALRIHTSVRFILQHRYGSANLKVTLPLIVASLSGKPAALQAAENACGSRSRQSPNEFLQAEKQRVHRNEPDATWTELLDQLIGDGVVVDYNNDEIYWTNCDGESCSTATSTFRGWKTKP